MANYRLNTNKMEYKETKLSGVYILEPRIFNDARGYFYEVWKEEDFKEHVGDVHFVQDNESKSSYGVLRGLHYQKGDYAQAKLVRVLKGRVVDVAVNKRQFFIPRGFAHGFLVLSDEAIFTYKVDNNYAPQQEASILWNDKDLNIEWPISAEDIQTSEKDLKASTFKTAELF